MHVSWLRRALLAVACVSAIVVAACGGGTVVSQFSPSRVISFGDAFSDVGQRNTRYTVNDGNASTWNSQVAARYGLSLAPSASGGLGYAAGSARVSAVPDAAGNAATLSITQQVNAFLAGQSFTGGELVLVNGGIADIVVQAQAVRAGTVADAQALATVEQAAVDLAAQVKRLVTAGAKRVAVTGVYDLGRSPYAQQTGQTSRLTTLAAAFNVKLKTELFGYNIADRVLYIDAEYYYNLVILNPGSPTYGTIANVTGVACSSIDAGAGIGTGVGEINSSLCNTGTIVPGVTYTSTLFADRLYFTPIGNSVFGDYAFDRIRTRW